MRRKVKRQNREFENREQGRNIGKFILPGTAKHALESFICLRIELQDILSC